MKQQDTLFQKNLRNLLLDQIATDQSISAHVIDAMREVPRQFFVEDYQQEEAYEDKPLPIEGGQTISQTTTVAIQTNLLNVKKGDKVLEIGSGSGYQAAILHQMGCRVYSIERLERLHNLAKKNLTKIGFEKDIVLIHGDGFEGLPGFAPFDGIVVTCGAAQMPEKLKEQLSIGGRLVVPVGKDMQEMMVVERTDENIFETTNAGFFKFVPMIKGTGY